ncbi:MAG: hypothetical protein ACRDQ0_13040 [Pseudonocardia sp.]
MPDQPAPGTPEPPKPRPDDDVPDEWIQMMADAEYDAPPGCSAWESYRTVLAAVVPAIRQAERDRIADQILSSFGDLDPTDDYDQGVIDAARLARGETR